jgi:hypothetical protein
MAGTAAEEYSPDLKMSETIRATRPEPPPHAAAEIKVGRAPLSKWAIGEFFGTILDMEKLQRILKTNPAELCRRQWR